MGGRDERRIGWIGTGRMGYELAARLLRAGCDVAVWNRTREKAEPLAELGATIVDSPAALADRELVFTMMAGPEDFQEVTIGEGGVLTAEGERARGADRLVDRLGGRVRAGPRARGRARHRGAGGARERQPQGRQGRPPDGGGLGPAARRSRPARPYLELFGEGVTYAGEGDTRPPREALSQPAARHRGPVARRDHRAGREGRRVAQRLPGLHELERARLDLLPLQDTGLRQARLHADVHAGAAAQGLRPRPGGGRRARGLDAARRALPRARAER